MLLPKYPNIYSSTKCEHFCQLCTTHIVETFWDISFFLATKKMMRYFLSSISMHSFTVTCMLQCCWCCVSAACLANLHFFEDEFVPYAVLSDQSSFKLRLLPTEGKIQEPFFQRSVGLTEHLVRVRVDRGGDKNKQTLHLSQKFDWLLSYIFLFFHKWTNLVKHAVEQTRNHREDCGPQSFQVIHQKFDVSLEKADSASMDEDDALTRAQSCLYTQDLLVIPLPEHLCWCQ